MSKTADQLFNFKEKFCSTSVCFYEWPCKVRDKLDIKQKNLNPIAVFMYDVAI